MEILVWLMGMTITIWLMVISVQLSGLMGAVKALSNPVAKEALPGQESRWPEDPLDKEDLELLRAELDEDEPDDLG